MANCKHISYAIAIIGFLVFCSLIISCRVGRSETHGRNGDGSLSGYVQDEEHEPLANAVVRIECSDLYNETVTDGFGYYIITDVPIVECLWTVTASRQGYRHSSLERAIDEGSTEDFTLIPSRTWYVDDDASDGGNGSQEDPFNTIKEAVNASVDGDIVMVFNGTYHENINIDKTIFLYGSGSNETKIQGVEEEPTVLISEDGVTVQGFNISGAELETTLTISNAHDCLITNNLFDGTYIGILLERSNSNGIYGNEFRNVDREGILLSSSYSNRIENNDFENTSRYSILAYYSSYNVISKSSFIGNMYGVYLSHESLHNRIRNNTFDSHTYAVWLSSSSFNEISGNRISLNDIGIELYRESNLNVVRQNNITNNRIGIRNRYNSHITTVQHNSITNNSEYGLQVVQPNEVMIDARYNWWGTSFGPYHPTLNPEGEGDNVTDEILFSPWQLVEEGDPTVIISGYINDWMDDPIEGALVTIDCGFLMTAYTDDSGFYMIEGIPILERTWNVSASRSGFRDSWVKITLEKSTIQLLQLKPGDTHFVDDDAPRGGKGRLWSPFDTIQDAIDISEDGDTIHVFAGTYPENIVVHKRVTMIGNGSEQTKIIGDFGSSVIEITAEGTYISDMSIVRENDPSNWNGIELESSMNEIIDVEISGFNYGISIRSGSHHNRINKCMLTDNENGIYLWNASENSLSKNILQGNEIGITLSSCTNTTLKENTMEDGGLSMWGYGLRHFDSHTIDDSNTIGGLPIIYITNTSGSSIRSDYGQILLVNCSGIIMEDMIFNGSFHAISIAFSTYITVRNNTFSNGRYTSVTLAQSMNCIIARNQFQNASGISLWRSDNNSLLLNDIRAARYDGISLSYSCNNSVVGNICEEDYYGIALFEDSINNEIAYNILQLNRWGLYIGRRSDQNEISNNTFLDNTYGAVREIEDIEGLIDLRFNYWGHPSGPFNATTNPTGQGGSISEKVLFEPWYDGNGSLVYLPGEEKPEDDPNQSHLSILLLILLCLLVSLVIVVRMPNTIFKRKPDPSDQKPSIQTNIRSDPFGAHGQSARTTTCEHCEESFEISRKELALRVHCPHCGEYTLK